jgi:cell division cycle 20-like protein 1 (cofactor of APC complex)
MQKIATLTGHTYRVLYLAMNPEGSTIVTGAGDETLRFWNIFPAKDTTTKSLSKSTKSQLTEEMTCLR